MVTDRLHEVAERVVSDTDAKAARMLAEQHARVVEIDRRRALKEAADAANARTSPLAYIDCRTFGHSWVPIEADRNPAFGWYIVARCERCTTVRKQIADAFGKVSRGAQYTYPEHYKDTDHWTRAEWRMQFLRRLK